MGVVRDDDECGAQRMVGLQQEIEDRLRVVGVERARRLISQDDARMADERAGDGNPLALSARELIRELFGLVPDAEERERLETALITVSVPMECELHRDVFDDR